MEKKEKQYIYFRESALQSAIADLFMFVTLAGAMAVNYYYFGNSWFWGLILFGMFLLSSVARVKRRTETFTSKEELKKFINETL